MPLIRKIKKNRIYALLATFLYVIMAPTCYGQITSSNRKLILVDNIKQYKKLVNSKPSSKLILLYHYLQPFKTKIYYRTTENFTGRVLYHKHQLYINLEAAQKLAAVQDSLIKIGYNLLIFDCYRPYFITKRMWKVVPDERYTANPAKGSGHNRGIAIDLSLVNIKTGNPVLMPTAFDNFSDTAHHNFMELPAEAIENRNLLRSIMAHFGFISLSTEWWHYSLPNPTDYPIYNLNFNQLSEK